jgi:hypothetical protein
MQLLHHCGTAALGASAAVGERPPALVDPVDAEAA